MGVEGVDQRQTGSTPGQHVASRLQERTRATNSWEAVTGTGAAVTCQRALLSAVAPAPHAPTQPNLAHAYPPPPCCSLTCAIQYSMLYW